MCDQSNSHTVTFILNRVTGRLPQHVVVYVSILLHDKVREHDNPVAFPGTGECMRSRQPLDKNGRADSLSEINVSRKSEASHGAVVVVA